MKIERTETPTGGPNRTRRETIVPLFTGRREVEPEMYLDCSESEGWAWQTRPDVNTWGIQVAAVRSFIVPFEQLDSQAAGEQAGGGEEAGGVFAYPFSNLYLMLGDGPDDGDLNTANFDRKMTAFARKYFGPAGQPRGGTEIMTAITAGDRHFMDEFGGRPRDERPVRARVVWTDGLLNDADQFRSYLAQATLSPEGFGSHGEWDEAWAVGIIGEPDGGGKEAYDQYAGLAKDHPWIHPYYFEGVANPDEVAEDMAVAVVPTQA